MACGILFIVSKFKVLTKVILRELDQWGEGGGWDFVLGQTLVTQETEAKGSALSKPKHIEDHVTSILSVHVFSCVDVPSHAGVLVHRTAWM